MVRTASAAEASQLLHQMRDQVLEPDHVAVGSAVAACVAGGEWEEAVKLLSEVELWKLPAKSVGPVAYNAAIGACGYAHSAESALQLLERMDRQKIPRTTRTFGAAIGACGRGHAWPAALRLLEEMRDSRWPEVPGADAVAHAGTISACAKAVAWRHALVLIRTAEEWLHEPMSPAAYTVAIAACDRAGLWEQALAVFADMQQQQAEIGTTALNALLSACGRSSEWQQAVEAWNSPMFDNLADRVSSGLLIRALERAGQWSLALETFRELGAMRVELGTAAFNAAISSCALGRRWQFTLELLQQMPSVRVPMTRSTRNAALRAFDGPELIPAAAGALRLLRAGLGAAQTEEWHRQTLPRHLELTEHALDQAASQLELRLTNPEGVNEASAASASQGDKDFAERAERAPAEAQALPLELLSSIGPDLASATIGSLRRELRAVTAASLGAADADVFVHLVGSRLYG
ncbi:unnamed protein product, partial [Symbiodinium sp. CCMP2592]